MLLPHLVDCIKCTDGIVTKHYPNSDAQGNKVYYTEPCDCINGHRLDGYVDVTDLEDKIKDNKNKIEDVLNKVTDVLEKLNE